MKINFEAVLNTINNYHDAQNEYMQASARYRAKNGGLGVYLYNGKKLTAEEQHIHYWDCESLEASKQVDTIFEIFCVRRNDDRIIKAARALRQWYVRTGWERCAPSDLINRLECFVFGND